MATKFSDIYELFLGQIDDYTIVELDDAEVEILIEKYLINGLITVYSQLADTLDIDHAKKEFTSDLPLFTKILLAKSMKLEWVREKKYSEELMRKSIGDRDYKAVQGTDYLKQLTSVESELRKEIKRDLIDYSYGNTSLYGELI